MSEWRIVLWFVIAVLEKFDAIGSDKLGFALFLQQLQSDNNYIFWYILEDFAVLK